MPGCVLMVGQGRGGAILSADDLAWGCRRKLTPPEERESSRSSHVWPRLPHLPPSSQVRDANTIATGHVDGTVSLWDMRQSGGRGGSGGPALEAKDHMQVRGVRDGPF